MRLSTRSPYHTTAGSISSAIDTSDNALIHTHINQLTSDFDAGPVEAYGAGHSEAVIGRVRSELVAPWEIDGLVGDGGWERDAGDLLPRHAGVAAKRLRACRTDGSAVQPGHEQSSTLQARCSEETLAVKPLVQCVRQ